MLDTDCASMTIRDLIDIAEAAGVVPSELIAICEPRRAPSRPSVTTQRHPRF